MGGALSGAEFESLCRRDSNYTKALEDSGLLLTSIFVSSEMFLYRFTDLLKNNLFGF